MKNPIKTLIIALVIAALTVTFLFAGCTATHEAVLPPVRIAEKEIKALIPTYTLESAYEESDVVALVRVGDWIAEDNELLITYYRASAEKVFKGSFEDAQAGFTLVQEGCSKQTLRELPLFAAGNELLLFLTKANGGPYDNAYFITGNYSTLLYRVKDTSGEAYLFDCIGNMGKGMKDVQNLLNDSALKNRLKENEPDEITAELLGHAGWLFRESDISALLDTGEL
ncbi:MAG: hypothetical protein II409_01770 [Clostridia bacterium]|nr:hypothetical protein [Clostridia bacterium]